MQPSRRYSIGLIGAGMIANDAHLPSYFWGGNIKIVAVADENPKTLKEVASRWNIEHSFTDYSKLLEMPEIEVVDIATPLKMHKRVVIDALACGKHVLCQKPLSHNIEDALEMIGVAERNNRILAVNQNYRWIPSFRRCGELIWEGAIGQPLLTVFEDHYWCDYRPYELEDDRFLLLRNTIHKLDLFRFWFKKEPSLLFAQTLKVASHPARGESMVSITLNYQDGHVINLIDDGASSSPGFRHILIQGTEAALRVSDAKLEFFKKKPGILGEWQDIPLEGTRIPNAFYGTMAALLSAIEQGEQPEHNARENLKSLRLAITAYESAFANQAISLLGTNC